jgi:hypothetical protein
MKNILLFTILSSYLFSVGGIITFNDGTTIEGEIQSVTQSAVNIIPMGLTFAEDIRLENIDSLKLSDGNIIIENSTVIYLYQNGEFLDPTELENDTTSEDDYDLEYVVVPNWSANLYFGYPIIKATSFEEYDKSNILYGFSVGSPYGIFAGDFFMNAIFEFAYYSFQQSNNLKGKNFGGPAFQIGISPGLFVGSASVSLTACTGIYQSDDEKFKGGFIAGGSIDLPLGPYIIDRYGDKDLVESYEEFLEAFEIRITGRSNLIQKGKGYTGWADVGVSLGYEF